jgi:predicted nucleotidyltransferase
MGGCHGSLFEDVLMLQAGNASAAREQDQHKHKQLVLMLQAGNTSAAREQVRSYSLLYSWYQNT